LFLDGLFDKNWRDVLAGSGDEKLLKPPSNEQYAVGVDPTHIPRVKEPILIDCLCCLFRILVVAHENVSASIANFSLRLSGI